MRGVRRRHKEALSVLCAESARWGGDGPRVRGVGDQLTGVGGGMRRTAGRAMWEGCAGAADHAMACRRAGVAGGGAGPRPLHSRLRTARSAGHPARAALLKRDDMRKTVQTKTAALYTTHHQSPRFLGPSRVGAELDARSSVAILTAGPKPLFEIASLLPVAAHVEQYQP